MKKNLLRIISFIASISLVVGICAGCGNNGDKTTSGDKKNNSSNGKIDFLVDPEEYKGSTVVYATWKDPEKNEDGPVIKNFEEKYGINVDIMLIEQDNYINKIASAIASGTQPDIFFENFTFPGSLTVMQPLDNAKINFKDPIWDQNLIKESEIDGHPYLLNTLSNVWSEADICVYNKSIFENNGITSPQEYYDAGKWTFEAFRECAKQVASLGSSYTGAEIFGEVALAAAGCASFKKEGDKIVTGMDDKFYEVNSFLAQMKADGYATYSREGFSDGKTGLALTNAFALKKTGYYTTINPDHLGAVRLPVWKEGDPQYSSSIYRGWGLVKGAKNPVAAGIFLREYLDVNNYNLDDTFHSQGAANFFFSITSEQNANKIFYNWYGVNKATGSSIDVDYAWYNQTPAQVKIYLDSQVNVVKNACAQANDIIKNEKKWLAENFK